MKHFLFLFIFSFIAVSGRTQGNEEQPEKSSAGYYNLTQLSFIIGETDEQSLASNLVSSVTTINGYRINEHVAIGAGVGITAFKYIAFPVFADIRYHIFKGNFTPLIAFKGGYAFAGNSKNIFPSNYYYEATYKNTGGWMCHPEIGFKTAMNPSCDFVFTLGYYYQELKSEITESAQYRGYPLLHTVSANIHRVSFTIGFLFK
ncbi:MAG: hypothetical protein LBF81_05425 [Prevotellaceae bacterium]|jgi:hypothetical protein|nr:hypothetical protein [Prevotellaceae bacterium]